MAKFIYDPLGYVLFNYPWREGILAGCDGPDTWQVDILHEIGRLAANDEAVRIAVASGHGPGKTALVAWIIQWFLSTRPHPQVVCTSNTATQLEQKTWRELAKWHGISRNSAWFEHTATMFRMVRHPKTWFAAAVPWSKERPEAFAGTHEKHVLVVYDEASMIDDCIWEVTDGAMTTKGAMWLAFGNPTRNTGRFKECWGRFRHRWHTRQIDSRTAKMADHKLHEQWIEDYGIDSDFVKVRVLGQFPSASNLQFIGSDLVRESANRIMRGGDPAIRHAPIIIGVDVARFGNDETVILIRQGLAVLGYKSYRELDVITVGNLAINAEKKYNADAVFVDETGLGGGVVDYIRSIGHYCIGVNNGSRAGKDTAYVNMRAETWDKMRTWLKSGGSIPDNDAKFEADLTGIEYGFDIRNRLQLERKEDMKSRGLASPDRGDALALTFAADVENRDHGQRGPYIAPGENKNFAEIEYDVFGV